jgi:DNA-binding Lrp family transcriptional regulator
MSGINSRTRPRLHPDVYPVVRVSTEFFLRSFEVIGRLHRDVVSCLIITTLWHKALAEPDASKPMGIRELSRRLELPFETVRRHVRRLVRSGACLAANDGVGLAPTMLRSARASAMLRRIYLDAVRMLGDLRRIDVVNYRPHRSPSPDPRHLDKEQTIIVVAAIGVLLAAMKVLRRSFDGDLMNALVFTAIWAANVKHITNRAPAANRGILPDSDRLPVSMLAISDSMGVPYETVRRHARKLVKHGNCIRLGRRGLIAPESAFRQMTIEANAVRQLILEFLAELRGAGVRV